MRITIDTDKIAELAKEGEDIVMTSEAEGALVELLELEKGIKKAIDKVKHNIAKKAEKLNPNISSIKSDRLKIYYRQYGSKYYLDDQQLDRIPKNLYKRKVRYSVDSKQLEEYLKLHDGKMPIGIRQNKREKKISFSLVDDE